MIPNKETVLKENCPDLPPAFPVPFLWVDNSNDNDDAMQIDVKIMIIKKNVFAIKLTFEFQHMACLHLYERTWIIGLDIKNTWLKDS